MQLKLHMVTMEDLMPQEHFSGEAGVDIGPIILCTRKPDICTARNMGVRPSTHCFSEISAVSPCGTMETILYSLRISICGYTRI